MDKRHTQSLFVPACFKAWRLTAVLAAAIALVSASSSAQNTLRPASGIAAASGKVVPQVLASSGAADQTLTYSFPAPEYSTSKDGVTMIAVPGLKNFGNVGDPSLPVLPVRIAVPQGRAVASVTVTPGESTLLATGLTLDHVQKYVKASRAPAAFVPTARNEAVYSSAEPFPAKPESTWTTAWKNGVAFCELTLCPIVYIPASGEVRYYSEITVKVNLHSSAGAVRGGAARPAAPAGVTAFQTQERASDVMLLVDNPAVVSAYAPAAGAKSLSVAKLDGELDTFIAEPALPCDSSNTFVHVIITTEILRPAFIGLAQYRRNAGVASTIVTVEAIRNVYGGAAADDQDAIRNFIKDAYATWGTAFVVLGGDIGHVPARCLHGTVDTDVDELPSDLYYQCLDGDFDANGNGIYGEEDDDVDYYAEVAIGRVSAETVDEVACWLAKVKKYDADCAVGEDYTRGSMFVGEYVGPYDNTYAKPLLEVMRIGTKAAGGRLFTYGFEDVPDLFDADREVTIYEQDQDWDAGTLISEINEDGVAVINHMGHSDYDYNMKLSLKDVDGLKNKNPVFVYSQGCIAGAFDKDCIAEHFTTSTQGGAFAGVWNSRYGWYSYNSQGIANVEGPSEVYHRRFWDVVFRNKLHALGTANMLSHEFNAAQARRDECLRWCYYETNLFGDPMQNISGDGSSLTFDREAYKSSAVATITYKGVTDEETVDVVFSAVRKTYDPDTFAEAGSENLVIVSPTELTLFYAGMADGCSFFTNSVVISDFELDADPAVLVHDDVLYVAMADGSFGMDSAYIDDVAPAFREVKLRNPDEGLVTSQWITYSPDKSDPEKELFTDEDTICEFYLDDVVPFVSPTVVFQEEEKYVSEHSAEVADLPCALYYVRILAVDKAGNTNVWCSAEVSENINSGNVDEHGKIIVAARTLRAAYDMEKDASSWTDLPAGQTCWELGTPVYGPENASRCYGTALAGRYPDGVNDALVSPTITLGANPTIAFRQWYDIERTPEGAGNLDNADYGIVEVLMTGADGSYSTPGVIDGAWHNVLQYARENKGEIVQGVSDGWEEVRILLPEEYNGKTIQVRFRFVSDTFTAGLGNPAGWYIDNVRFYDVAEGGVALQVAEIDDSEGGNGDGAVQPGETFKVKFASCNISYDTLVIPDGCGTISLSASGSSVGKATLVGGSPAAVSYPPLQPGALVPANETFEITVDPSIPYGASITVVQTLIDQNGKRYESYVTIPVSNPCGFKGFVMQPTGNPVVNAEVSVNTSEADYSFITGEDGTFEITGLSSNRQLRVFATYGYATTNVVVITPADDVEIILPLAEIGVSPTDIKETMSSVDDDIVVSFVISNFFVLAELDGNVGPSCNLDYEIGELIDAQGAALDWIELVSPATGSIEPNGTAEIELKLTAKGVDTSIPHNAALRIRSNAWNEEEVAVMISLDIEHDLYLEADGVSATEFDPELAEDLGVAPGDGDGLLESGESGEMYFSLFNPDENEIVNGFEGEIECVSGNATVIDGYIYWETIYPQASAKSIIPAFVTIAAAPGEVVTFRLSGEVNFGEDEITVQDDLYFDYTNLAYNAVSGSFTTLNLVPADPPGATNAVANAYVTLTGANGDVLKGSATTAEGLYTVTGLTPGEKYWVSFETSPNDNSTVPPPAFLITADENMDDGTPAGLNFTSDIVGSSYGATNPVPHLRMMSVEVTDADGDGKIDFGEEFSISVEVMNDGRLSTALDSTLTAVLTLPEFEREQCMELVNDTDSESVTAIGMDETAVFSGFSARAFAYGDCEPRDYQRFSLEVFENTGTDEAKRWYFDFALTIDPSFSISGTVENTVEGHTVKGTQIKAENADGTFVSVITLDDDAATAEYEFNGLDAGEYTVSVVAVPADCECDEPSVLSQEIISEDWTGADFTLIPWSVSVEVDSEYINPDDGGIHVEIDEGESTSVPLTVTNTGTDETDVKLTITYNRKDSEVLSMDQIADSLAAAKAALNAKLGNDWTKLNPSEFNAGELEVTFKPGTPVAARDAYLARHGFVASYHFTTIPASIAVPATKATGASRAVAALKNPASFRSSPADDVMVTIQPSALSHGVKAVELPPEDPLYGEQWALNNTRQNGGTLGADIGAEAAWSYLQSTGSEKVHVAVTDTGIYYNHPDLIGNWTGFGWDYVLDTSACDDENGHGTHVAGIIGAVGNNGIGISGANWKVGLVSSRICRPIMGQEVWASNAQIARAFEESYTLFGCTVNNNSWGGPIYSQILYDIIERSKDWGMLYVIAAGNDADDIDVVPTYPACYSQWLDNVIVVAAADSDDNVAFFSSYSPKFVHLAAPGYDILSTYLDLSNGKAPEGTAKAAGEGNYARLSGTSMAAPYVSGAAALLKSISPTASYKVIRDALLNGVRKDDGLADFVSTSGHLDIGNSVRLLGNMWIRYAAEDDTIVLTTNVTLAAGESVDLELLINDPPALMAGTYSASIDVENVLSSRTIPVTLDVYSAPVPAIESVAVVDEQNPDGQASFGEEATLSIVLKNVGTCEFEDLSAILVAENGTVIDDTVDFGYLPGFDTTDPALQFRVAFPASGDTADFILEVYEAGELVDELPVSIELFNGSVVKVTVTDAGAPVENAIVEVIGGSAARTTTAADGIAYVAVPATESSAALTLRVFTDNAVRYSAPLASSAKDVAVALKHATLTSADGNDINITITEGMSATADIILSATADAGSVSGTVGLANRAKIAVIDDSTNATFVVSALKDMGFDVDYYGDNFTVVRYVDPASETSEIQYMVRYSWDDAMIFGYDAVIAIISGTTGTGRLLIDEEAQAYRDYIARGGKVFFAGNALLSRPDNLEIAEMLGLSEDACFPVNLSEIYARVSEDGLGAPFANLAAGDAFPVCAGAYDQVDETVMLSGSASAEMEEAGVAKIYKSELSDRGGQAVLWNGSAEDWASDGTALDIIRGYFYNEFVASADLGWITTASRDVTVNSGASSVLTLNVNPELSLGVGEYSAVVCIAADTDGSACQSVVVNVTVMPPVVRAHNLSGNVTDWGNRYLLGDGGSSSCMFQLIYAGEDGEISEPGEDGMPTGDDVVLAASGTGLNFSYFGAGRDMTANVGQFDVNFNLEFEGFVPGAEGVMLYVRAWDSPSAASSIAYGDSELFEVTYENGSPAAIDFGSWTVGSARDNLGDSNGDSIPDAWGFEYRPDLDPRAEFEALDVEFSMPASNSFPTAIAAANYNADGNPARVFVTENFIVVLEQFTHRIAVHNREYPYEVVNYYGATVRNGPASNHMDETYDFSNADGAFNQPFGMALDAFTADITRFAVADKNNNRVQLFSLDESTGAITFLAKYGTKTPDADIGNAADTATMSAPLAVAFMKGGDLIVSDSDNFRVLRLRTTGNTLVYKTRYDFTTQSRIFGLCYDKDSAEGFWVVDGGREKQCVAFYHTAAWSQAPVVSFGEQDSKDFVSPRDVKVWTVGARKRIIVADYSGSRVRILNLVENDRGAYTELSVALDVGSSSDKSLQEFEKFWLPNGLFPIDDENLVYVADYGHNMIKWFNVSFDLDGDGMDDIWEDLHGLDSTVDDSMDDLDGDGLLNIGEFRSGCDPENADTDGDGVGDLAEMNNLRDPLDSNEPEWTPAEIISVTVRDVNGAEADEFLVTSNAVIEVTFDREVTGDTRIELFNADGDCMVKSPMVVDGATASYTFTATQSAIGLVDARFTFADCDPPSYDGEDLFTVVAPAFVSVTAYDENGNEATEFLVSSNVTVKVVFDSALADTAASGSYALYNEANELLAMGLLAAEGDTMSFSYTPVLAAAGNVTAVFTFVNASPAAYTADDLFTVIVPDDPVPPPEPETEEIRWSITSIKFITDGAPSLRLTWDYPTTVEAGTECKFRIERKASLTDPEWTALDEVSAADASACVYDVDLTKLGDVSSNFFRLWWLNSPKE